KIVEVAGRNSGWLAAAAALARTAKDTPPHLIYFPERPRALDRMVQEIRAPLERHGYAVAVICENQRDSSGEPLAGEAALRTDQFGHTYHESPGQALAQAVAAKLGVVA